MYKCKYTTFINHSSRINTHHLHEATCKPYCHCPIAVSVFHEVSSPALLLSRETESCFAFNMKINWGKCSLRNWKLNVTVWKLLFVLDFVPPPPPPLYIPVILFWILAPFFFLHSCTICLFLFFHSFVSHILYSPGVFLFFFNHDAPSLCMTRLSASLTHSFWCNFIICPCKTLLLLSTFICKYIFKYFTL